MIDPRVATKLCLFRQADHSLGMRSEALHVTGGLRQCSVNYKRSKTLRPISDKCVPFVETQPRCMFWSSTCLGWRPFMGATSSRTQGSRQDHPT